VTGSAHQDLLSVLITEEAARPAGSAAGPLGDLRPAAACACLLSWPCEGLVGWRECVPAAWPLRSPVTLPAGCAGRAGQEVTAKAAPALAMMAVPAAAAMRADPRLRTEQVRVRSRCLAASTDGLARDSEGFLCRKGAGDTAAFARGAVSALGFHLRC
jgi:hypothetical protein